MATHLYSELLVILVKSNFNKTIEIYGSILKVNKEANLIQCKKNETDYKIFSYSPDNLLNAIDFTFGV